MKRRYRKYTAVLVICVCLMSLLSVSCLATSDREIYDIIEPVEDFINSLFHPFIIIVAALATPYCVLLGAKYAKAEEPQDRQKAKDSLKNAILGFALIFVLTYLMRTVFPLMEEWVSVNADSLKFGAVNFPLIF